MRRLLPMSQHAISSVLTRLGTAAAHPLAFLTVIVYAIAWFFIERETFDWHGVATLATWTMTIFITRAAYRDMQAVHAKLDELLRTEEAAHIELTRLDRKEPEEVERHREVQQRRDDAAS